MKCYQADATPVVCVCVCVLPRQLVCRLYITWSQSVALATANGGFPLGRDATQQLGATNGGSIINLSYISNYRVLFNYGLNFSAAINDDNVPGHFAGLCSKQENCHYHSYYWGLPLLHMTLSIRLMSTERWKGGIITVKAISFWEKWIYLKHSATHKHLFSPFFFFWKRWNIIHISSIATIFPLFIYPAATAPYSSTIKWRIRTFGL